MLEAVIDRIEEEVAVLHLEGGQELKVPISKLPNEVGEGDVVYLEVRRDKEATASRAAAAKEMLNELLKTE